MKIQITVALLLLVVPAATGVDILREQQLRRRLGKRKGMGMGKGKGKGSSSDYCHPLIANLENPAEPGVCDGANVCGVVIFDCPKYANGYTQVTYDITGLTPGQLHAMHVHENPVHPDCASTGGHWNPEHLNHGSNLDLQRHIGDLGNILADVNGTAVGSLLARAPLSGYLGINGRAVVIHEGADDLGRGGDDGSRAVGNAGGRPACGTITELH